MKKANEKKYILGFAKFLFERQRGYISVINTVILIKLFFQNTEFKLWYLIFIPFYILFVIFDVKVIYRQERSYADGKSDVLNEILNGKK